MAAYNYKWDTPLTKSMLTPDANLIVHCPKRELISELEAFIGVDLNSVWSEYGENTCYRFSGAMLVGHYDYAPIAYYDRPTLYTWYTRCTFYGFESENECDGEVSDDDFEAILYGR